MTVFVYVDTMVGPTVVLIATGCALVSYDWTVGRTVVNILYI